jgi:hypothetical protein
MASQNAIACLLIATGVLLLAIVNQLGWLLVLVPVALLVARSMAGHRAGAKHHGARI